MKFVHRLLLLGLFASFILTSCRIEKRVHLPGYHVNWNKNQKTSSEEDLALHPSKKKASEEKMVLDATQKEELNQPNTALPFPETKRAISNKEVDRPDEKSAQKVDFHNALTDKGVGERQTSTFKSKFKKRTQGIWAPTRAVAPDKSSAHYQTDSPRANGFAVGGFVFSILALFVFAFILGGLSIIFCSIGLAQINNDRDKWSGTGLAIAGLVIGIVAIISWAIILALMF
jgi:hypothetical protein